MGKELTVVRADQSPGRRRAVPAKDTTRRQTGLLARLRPDLSQVTATVWLLVTALGMSALALAWSPISTPRALPLAGAVTITTCFTFGLAVRTGGRPLISGTLALALSAGAVLSGLPILLAAAAMSTAVVAAILAVLATTPAAGFPVVVRECVVALSIGVIGAFAVEAYPAQVSMTRFGYVALGLALLGAMVLVYRLGAGLSGLGKRGFVMVLTGIILLTVVLAYTEALTRWGPPGLGASIEDLTEMIQSTLGAVPRPVEFLLGIPALAWGVSTRARRRQGWWVCAFGAAGIAAVASSLLDSAVPLTEAGLAVLYSTVIGLGIGYLIIRADKFLTGSRGRRGRRLEEAAAHRPEPGRMRALL